MKHSLYLLITSIGCGIILSSCQSRVKNSSFYNDTDTVKTIMESVDSTSVIEEKKRLQRKKHNYKKEKQNWTNSLKNSTRKRTSLAIKLGYFLITNLNTETEMQLIAIS